MGVAIIAEASGEAEAHDQLPLRPYAPSGAILERTLRRMGYARDQFVLSNIVRCRPWNNFLEGAPYEQAAISHCQPNVLSLLNRYKPKVIVALGNVPFRTLTGISGKQRTISHMRGYVFRALPEYCAAAGNPDLLVVPTYHPAFLRRGAIHLTGVLARDIQRAVNIRAGRDKNFILDMPAMNYTDITNDPFADDSEIHAAARGQSDLTAWMARHGLRYQLNPTLADLDAFCREVKAISDRWVALSPDAKRHDLTALSYDLETGESVSLDEDASDGFTDTIIKQVQFSTSAQTGVAFPWQQPYIKAAHWLLKLPLPKIGQNIYYFDNRVLEAVGERDFGKRDYFTPAGPVHDILQMFHFWQPDLPAHLQFAASFAEFPFPWKHLSDTNLPFYGCVDVDAPHRVYRVMRQTMEDRGIWDDPDRARAAYGYVNQLEAVRPILAEMEDTGIPINNERRMALGVEFDAAEMDLLAELDKMFPSAARKVHPKEGYKKIPPQVKALLANGTPESDIPAVAFQDSPSARPDGTEKEGDFYHYEIREFAHPTLLESGDVSTSWIPRWCRAYNFSPNSPNQVRAYMRVRGHKIPLSKDGDETTGKHELVKLANKHKDKFYAKIIECREVRKMRSTYIDGYKPRADGRVHPTFTFYTATGQLSARNPNSQNYPSRSRLADAVKSMIEAPEGYEIANWDFKSYHVLTLGLLAGDAAYMRMGSIDMHSFVTSHFLKVPGADKLHLLSDDELRAEFSRQRKDERFEYVRNNQSKPSLLGIALGLMPPHLYEMNREHFDSLAHAKKFREVIQGLFPRVFQWQAEICEQAHREGRLTNRFGMVRWFYEVKRPDGHGGMVPGDQYNEAMAFPVQSEAHGELREKIKKLAAAGHARKYGLCNTIHDSLTFCYRRDLRESHIRDVYAVLRQPSEVLRHPVLAPGGLIVGVECSVGKSMAKKDRETVSLDG